MSWNFQRWISCARLLDVGRPSMLMRLWRSQVDHALSRIEPSQGESDQGIYSEQVLARTPVGPIAHCALLDCSESPFKKRTRRISSVSQPSKHTQRIHAIVIEKSAADHQASAFGALLHFSQRLLRQLRPGRTFHPHRPAGEPNSEWNEAPAGNGTAVQIRDSWHGTRKRNPHSIPVAMACTRW